MEWAVSAAQATSSGGSGGSLGATKSVKNSGSFRREDLGAIQRSLAAIALRASFVALPYTDPNDGQTVLCYRSYFPAGMAAVY
jgi:hypothetical protein